MSFPTLRSNPHLAEARQRLQRLRSLDLSRTLNKRSTWFSVRRTEAYRLRLAEAWRRAHVAVGKLETHLAAQHAAHTPSPHSLRQSVAVSVESFKAELLTHYCANIMQYQAADGRRPGVPARQIPSEWMQVAAAAALFSVVHTALMLWVMQRPARRSVVRSAPVLHFCFVPAPRFVPAYRALNLPLRL